MKRLMMIILGLLLLLLVGGSLYFSVSDQPAPQQRIEKAIPNDKLGQ